MDWISQERQKSLHDDAPELTAAFFKSADLYEGTKIKARGRPKAVTSKEPVKLRLDADVLAALRASLRLAGRV